MESPDSNGKPKGNAAAADDAGETFNSLSLEEVKTLVGGLLSAGVDTTGGLLTWKLLFVALCATTQERIHAELSASMNRHSVDHLIPACITPKEAPYLHAALRESHRLANTTITIPMKTLIAETVVHDVTLPASSVVLFDSFTTGMRPDLVGDQGKDFDPSRFLPDAIAARKGTAAAILDHPFFVGPFSQGARKCPGSRVANMEAAALLGQLVLDWHITVPGIQHWTDVPYDLETLTTAQMPPMQFSARV